MPFVSVMVMPFALFAMMLMPFGLDGWAFWVMGKGLTAMIAVANWFSELSPLDSVGLVPSRCRHRADRRAGAGDLADHLAAHRRVAGGACRPGDRLRPHAAGCRRLRGWPAGRCPHRRRRACGQPHAPQRLHHGRLAKGADGRHGRQARRTLPRRTLPRPRPPISDRFRCSRDVCLARTASGAVVAYTAIAANAAALCSSASLIVIDDATAENPCAARRRHRAHQARPRPPRQRVGQLRRWFDDACGNVSFAIDEPYRPWHAHRAFSREARGMPPYQRKKKPRRSRYLRRARRRHRSAAAIPLQTRRGEMPGADQ